MELFCKESTLAKFLESSTYFVVYSEPDIFHGDLLRSYLQASLRCALAPGLLSLPPWDRTAIRRYDEKIPKFKKSS